MFKIRRDFWQLLTLIANTSGMHRRVENLNSTWSTIFHCILGEKNLVNFGPLIKKLQMLMLTHPTGLFSGTILRPSGGAGPSNFCIPYNLLKCISRRMWGTRRPQVGLCPIFLVLYIYSAWLIGIVSFSVMFHTWLNRAGHDRQISCSRCVNICQFVESKKWNRAAANTWDS